MKKLLVILCLYMTVLTSFLYAQTTTEKLDQLMTAYVTIKEFSGSVLVARHGEILLQKGYGIKNIQQQSLNDVNTLYPIASVTKTFTSTLILKLVERKLMSLQDKLSKYYPDYPHGDSITIENLLTHTSGIYNYTRNNDFMFSAATKPADEQKMLSLFKNQPLDFTPGTDWNYSNSGYSLLGYIIQKVTNMSYQQAMRKYVFAPLQMKHSGFNFAGLPINERAIGYYSDSGKDYNKQAPLIDSSISFAAGSIYSTIGDLYKWHQGLQQYSVINKASLDKAFSPLKHNYGFGWQVDSLYGKRIVSHSGGIWGFRSNFARIIEDDICVVLLDNTEAPGLNIITQNILAILYNKPYTIPVKKQAVLLSEDVLKQYTGTYEISELHLVIEVKLEKGALVAYPFKGPKSELAPSDESHFFDKEQEGIEIYFEKTRTGEVDKMVINMNGNVKIARKK